ncbi:DUF6236 family protein [Sporomusa sp. KB1]|jgi:hypothetical protein|uniref:DUF6236 family protein n=1 Tax=Sporomusa sp. KB1 TaxID=943346 RepID=UPI0011A87C1B|nr:DUF6236 family protein [Sporomusa sp. KB1]TWH47981.1 hypothetical protein Salpa_4109 [Sporomusa sp. KB1]
MLKNALYYPHMTFQNPSWLKAMAMYYENIYRIVPDNIIPDDPEELQSLLEDSSIGKMLNPIRYAKATAHLFLKKKENWNASALIGDDEEEKEKNFIRVHEDKTDISVRKLFLSLGYQETDSWIDLPIGLASNYMLFLATEIAKKNKLDLITDSWAPWTATTYFNVDGNIDEFLLPCGVGGYSENIDDPFALFCLLIGEITPINIHEIPAEKIVAFRDRRRDEISNFRNKVEELYEELQSLDDPVVRYDSIINKVKELEKAKREYQDSADIIKAKKWFGASFMGFPAPLALGSVFNIPVSQIVTLAATSIAIGGLFNIKNSKVELNKLKKDNPASLLVEIERSFKQYTRFRGVGDMNHHAYNCMEEYIND